MLIFKKVLTTLKLLPKKYFYFTRSLAKPGMTALIITRKQLFKLDKSLLCSNHGALMKKSRSSFSKQDEIDGEKSSRCCSLKSLGGKKCASFNNKSWAVKAKALRTFAGICFFQQRLLLNHDSLALNQSLLVHKRELRVHLSSIFFFAGRIFLG